MELLFGELQPGVLIQVNLFFFVLHKTTVIFFVRFLKENASSPETTACEVNSIFKEFLLLFVVFQKSKWALIWIQKVTWVFLLTIKTMLLPKNPSELNKRKIDLPRKRLKFKKSGIFGIFGQIWQLFFSNAILRKIGPTTIKNGFSEII